MLQVEGSRSHRYLSWLLALSLLSTLLATAAPLRQASAQAAASATSYRILDGQMSYVGSADLSCTWPAPSCYDTDPPSQWGVRSYKEHSLTNLNLAVHAPGEPSGEGVAFAPMNIETWHHEWDTRTGYSLTPCGGSGSQTERHSDIQHDGGTSPSFFNAAVVIEPGGSLTDFSLSLMPAEATEPRFGWQWPVGLRWNESDRYSTVMYSTDTQAGECSGSYSDRRLLSARFTDFYPDASRIDQDAAPTYTTQSCAGDRCVVRVEGIDAWTYNDPMDGDTLVGSMQIDWWFDVETTSGEAGVCDTWKQKSRKWNARTPIGLLPDRDWGDYKVTVEWCYDSNSGYGRLLSIRSRGVADGGPLAAFSIVADLFGFETRWENQECEPNCGDVDSQDTRLASVSRKMAFCFDWTELVDKLGIKGWIKDKLRPGLKKRFQAYIETNGGLAYASDDVLMWVDHFAYKLRNKIDNIDVKLMKNRVPERIAEWIEDQVEGPFDKLLEKWKFDISEALYMGRYDELTAELASDLTVDIFVEVLGLFRICDAGGFIFGDDYPGFMTLWRPAVTVNLLSDGRIDFTKDDVYKSPFLRIRRV